MSALTPAAGNDMLRTGALPSNFPTTLEVLTSPAFVRLGVQRVRVGRVAALAATLLVLMVLDLLQASVGQRSDEFRVVAGQDTDVGGLLTVDIPEAAQARQQLLPRLSLSPGPWHLGDLNLQDDYWLGRPQWRGHLTAEAEAPAGPQTLHLTLAGETPAAEATQVSTLTVLILPDEATARATDPAITMRWLGFSPIWGLSGSGLLFLLAGAGVAWLSHRREQLLHAQGLLEVFRREPQPSGWRLFFSCPATIPMPPEDAALGLYTEAGRWLGTASRVGPGGGTVGAVVLDSPTALPPYLLLKVPPPIQSP